MADSITPETTSGGTSDAAATVVDVPAETSAPAGEMPPAFAAAAARVAVETEPAAAPREGAAAGVDTPTTPADSDTSTSTTSEDTAKDKTDTASRVPVARLLLWAVPVLVGLAGVAMYQENPLLAALFAVAAVLALAGGLISKRRARARAAKAGHGAGTDRKSTGERQRRGLLAGLLPSLRKGITSTNEAKGGSKTAGATGREGLRRWLPAALGGGRGKGTVHGPSSGPGATKAAAGSPFQRALAAMTGGRLGGGAGRAASGGGSSTGTGMTAGTTSRLGTGRGLFGLVKGGSRSGGQAGGSLGGGPRQGLLGLGGGGNRATGVGRPSGGRGLLGLGGGLPSGSGGRSIGGGTGRGLWHRATGLPRWMRPGLSLLGRLVRVNIPGPRPATPAPGGPANGSVNSDGTANTGGTSTWTSAGSGSPSSADGPEVVTAHATRMDTGASTTTAPTTESIGASVPKLPPPATAGRANADPHVTPQPSAPAAPVVVPGGVVNVVEGPAHGKPQVTAQKGTTMSTAIARFDPSPYTAMIDRSTRATLCASLSRAAQLVRADAAQKAEKAEALRAEAGRLPETPLTQEAASALRAEAARLAEDAHLRIGWASGVEAKVSQLT